MNKFKAIFSLLMLIGSFMVVSWGQEENYTSEGQTVMFFGIISIFYWLYKGFCALFNIMPDDLYEYNDSKSYKNNDLLFDRYKPTTPRRTTYINVNKKRVTSDREKESYSDYKNLTRDEFQTKTEITRINKVSELLPLNEDIEIIEIMDEVKEEIKKEEPKNNNIIGPPLPPQIPKEHKKYLPQNTNFNLNAIQNGTATENISDSTSE